MTTPTTTAQPKQDPIALLNQQIQTLLNLGQIEIARNTELIQRRHLGGKIAGIISVPCELVLQKYIGQHASVITLKDKVRKLADPTVNASVCIVGETGTGKELLARALHGSRTGNFVAMNCTALPSELIESELFGHVKGAFTGADSDRAGKMVAAKDGTLFLDEVGDMPSDMQAKLLRSLQERVVVPVGSDKEVPISCRVIAATNKSPVDVLRSDLFWRLCTFTVETVPLRDRLSDLQLLVDDFLGKPNKFSCQRFLEEQGTSLTGNMRQLQAGMENYKVFGAYSC